MIMGNDVAPTLVVLAAGIGSRFGGWKQIEPLGPSGEITIDYSIFDAWRAGFGRVVFVVRPEVETPMRNHFTERLRGRMEMAFVRQRLDDLPSGFTVSAARSKPWGTAHAVWVARNVVRGPFAVINADDFYGAGSYRILGAYLARGADTYAMVGFPLRNTLSPHGTVSRGICSVTAHGFLTAVVERTRIRAEGDGAAFEDETGAWRPLTGDEIASMNMWGFTPGFFEDATPRFRAFLEENGNHPKAEFFLPSVVDTLIRGGRRRVRVLPTEEHWFGITYAADLEGARQQIMELVQHGVYPKDLWAQA